MVSGRMLHAYEALLKLDELKSLTDTFVKLHAPEASGGKREGASRILTSLNRSRFYNREAGRQRPAFWTLVCVS